MFCTVIGKRRSFRFIISPFTAESPPERTEYFGIVSRPPTRECGSKGQVSSPKRNHAARKLRVIFGLMPALFFICFAKIESRLKCKTEKSCAWSNGFYIRASIDPWQVSTRGPKFEIAEFLPRSELVGECLPQTQQNERNGHFFLHGGVQKYGDRTIRPSAVM